MCTIIAFRIGLKTKFTAYTRRVGIWSNTRELHQMYAYLDSFIDKMIIISRLTHSSAIQFSLRLIGWHRQSASKVDYRFFHELRCYWNTALCVKAECFNGTIHQNNERCICRILCEYIFYTFQLTHLPLCGSIESRREMIDRAMFSQAAEYVCLLLRIKQFYNPPIALAEHAVHFDYNNSIQLKKDAIPSKWHLLLCLNLAPKVVVGLLSQPK